IRDDDVAKLTFERASARLLYAAEPVAVHLQQVNARRRAVAHIDLVDLHVVVAMGALAPFSEELRPGVLAFALEQHVTVRSAPLGEDIANRAAHAHETAALPERVRHLEEACLLDGHCGQRDYVALGVEIDRLDVLVDDLDVEFRWSQRGEDGEAERRHDGREAADLRDIPEAPERDRKARVDEQNLLTT